METLYKSYVNKFHPFEFTAGELNELAAHDVHQIKTEPLKFIAAARDYLEAEDDEAAELRKLIITIILSDDEDDAEDLPF